MDMKLLAYQVNFDETGQPTVKKHVAGPKEEELVFRSDDDSRSTEGLKLETAYRLLEDYKNIQTSEKYLEEFVNHFFIGLTNSQKLRVTPSEIEEWLDDEMDADPEDITGQKD